MQADNMIVVKNVNKSFKVYYDKGSQLKEKVLFRSRNRYEERNVLKDISFAVKRGEAIGLIGNNGCGKSTTLKLLTKIIYPDSGSIELYGRVSSLIELGAGFHPDMSGRENIYTNAAIFGLTRKEIDARVEDIINFSELEEYIDNPVRTYSSGMYMRLAFSVAINVDAEILLIDEILAVGDARFQAKCFNRLREIKASGTTIVIVSHSTSQIEQICDRAMWIKNGKIEELGTSREVIQDYLSWIMGSETGKELISPSKVKNAHLEAVKEEQENEQKPEKATEPENLSEEILTPENIIKLRSGGKVKELGTKEVIISKYSLKDGKTGSAKSNFSIEDCLSIQIEYQRKNKDVKEMICSLGVYRSDGILCYTTNSLIDTGKNIEVQNQGIIEINLEKVQFLQGEYSMDISLMVDYGPVYHDILNAVKFSVYNARTDYGIFRPEISWRMEGGKIV